MGLDQLTRAIHIRKPMRGRRAHGPFALASFAMCISYCSAASATETDKYAFDALGRLTTSSITSGPNDGIAASSTYDKAGNRSLYKVTGAAGSTPAAAQATLEDQDASTASGQTKGFEEATTNDEPGTDDGLSPVFTHPPDEMPPTSDPDDPQ